ncbi:hypothetical protein EUGRSUZ_H03848 [Eucalyptus grandis]|uniref:Uncharacterized protein n=2 Tax=Eucalyptus grandis TaxID=71139 RepID=A0A059B598_EUCGR|nr:hypothetical protein EUGRSUZ_H03848 [Eucalyptus grandis]
MVLNVVLVMSCRHSQHKKHGLLEVMEWAMLERRHLLSSSTIILHMVVSTAAFFLTSVKLQSSRAFSSCGITHLQYPQKEVDKNK